MDQLGAIRAFVRVVEAGSFAKAADTMGAPRSTVSKLVQDLEASLSLKLFERTTRSVTVTPEGVAYYERAIRLIADFDEMNNEATRGRLATRGKLRVDVGGTFANAILIPRLPEFYALYPEIELHLGVTERQADIVEEGIDCVIRAGDLPSASLVARKLCSVEIVTCATPSYLEKHGVPASPSDLQRDHIFVQYFFARSLKAAPVRLMNGDEKIEIYSPIKLSTSDATAHLHGILAGLGIGQTFEFLARPHIARGALVPIMNDWAPPRYPVHIARPAGRFPSLKYQVFSDWVAGVFSAYDDDTGTP
ncbi:LysR family transcriptional regulator [Rhizobium lentis]|uniref:HTH-type transcriptional regulator TtuA n=1 Tax=Rhizobium lentis TaxID=1138194 RepID=A0A9Q3MGI6_9HYPH|nr:LysR family transcriptional regulator [Rhizobium lentis]MBX4959534.1 LysR family transcriptional regulator [Rhizobium lentis]MBX4973314.1 LysR family transcriptional regulator [Rhizobium lentis]MBX4989666.1 LysR family transcriptional regulator [Rhizobium lentis]MBX5007983.1 LysR family transcriptional regulator [Rhizobium lentis]MBX5012406.1 LysR family transcriptional regulator [Rhizobium lentis]